MKVRKLGYACINHSLQRAKPRVITSRTMRKKTFKAEGMEKISELSLDNLRDLLTILEWNESRGIKLFRMSSDLFPWKSEWDWKTFPELKEAQRLLAEIGAYARKHDHRLTFHPGPFNKLCSPIEEVVQNTITDLEMHAELLDMMGFKPSYQNTINIHIGAAYGNKEETAKTWVKNFRRLSPSLKERLTVENDDKSSLYDTSLLYQWVYQEIGTPIMFDFHHHRCYFGSWSKRTEEHAANYAIKSWPTYITPLFHWSESRAKEQNNPKIRASAHSDLCKGPLPDHTLIREIDLMIEAKHKELSIPLITYHDGRKVHTT